jgi:hypothetical protein
MHLTGVGGRGQNGSAVKAAMARIAVDGDRKAHAAGNSARNGDALGRGRHAHIRQPGIGSDHPTGAHESQLCTCHFHQPHVCGTRGMEQHQHAVRRVDELLQACVGFASTTERSPCACRLDVWGLDERS